jgi:nitrite reductase/ring-hydroxylating ferredoxin subunit
MSASDLYESDRRRIEVEGNPVLLYRYGGTIYAIGAVCSHAGGPLEEGTFEEYCVTCPWHDSVYDVRDGTLVHGPTTYNQPRYRARIRNGQIELITDQALARLGPEAPQQEEQQQPVYGSG